MEAASQTTALINVDGNNPTSQSSDISSTMWKISYTISMHRKLRGLYNVLSSSRDIRRISRMLPIHVANIIIRDDVKVGEMRVERR